MCMGDGCAQRMNDKIIYSGSKRVAACFTEQMMEINIILKNLFCVSVGSDQCLQFRKIVFHGFHVFFIFIIMINDKLDNIFFKYLAEFIKVFHIRGGHKVCEQE